MSYEEDIAEANARIEWKRKVLEDARQQLEYAAHEFAREGLEYDRLRAEAMKLREKELIGMRAQVAVEAEGRTTDGIHRPEDGAWPWA